MRLFSDRTADICPRLTVHGDGITGLVLGFTVEHASVRNFERGSYGRIALIRSGSRNDILLGLCDDRNGGLEGDMTALVLGDGHDIAACINDLTVLIDRIALAERFGNLFVGHSLRIDLFDAGDGNRSAVFRVGNIHYIAVGVRDLIDLTVLEISTGDLAEDRIVRAIEIVELAFDAADVVLRSVNAYFRRLGVRSRPFLGIDAGKIDRRTVFINDRAVFDLVLCFVLVELFKDFLERHLRLGYGIDLTVLDKLSICILRDFNAVDHDGVFVFNGNVSFDLFDRAGSACIGDRLFHGNGDVVLLQCVYVVNRDFCAVFHKLAGRFVIGRAELFSDLSVGEVFHMIGIGKIIDLVADRDLGHAAVFGLDRRRFAVKGIVSFGSGELVEIILCRAAINNIRLDVNFPGLGIVLDLNIRSGLFGNGHLIAGDRDDVAVLIDQLALAVVGIILAEELEQLVRVQRSVFLRLLGKGIASVLVFRNGIAADIGDRAIEDPLPFIRNIGADLVLCRLVRLILGGGAGNRTVDGGFRLLLAGSGGRSRSGRRTVPIGYAIGRGLRLGRVVNGILFNRIAFGFGLVQRSVDGMILCDRRTNHRRRLSVLRRLSALFVPACLVDMRNNIAVCLLYIMFRCLRSRGVCLHILCCRNRSRMGSAEYSNGCNSCRKTLVQSEFSFLHKSCLHL